MLDSKYSGWEELSYQDLSYLQSPDKTKIAYQNGKMVELTWVWWNGGGVGPKPHETTEDYIRRRFSGSLRKREVNNLAAVLEALELKYKQKV
jgi:hypothetical protein